MNKYLELNDTQVLRMNDDSQMEILAEQKAPTELKRTANETLASTPKRMKKNLTSEQNRTTNDHILVGSSQMSSKPISPQKSTYN